MMEVGPWRWNESTSHEFLVKQGGWEEYTTMVFGMVPFFNRFGLFFIKLPLVDQPAGTGFSYTSTDRYVHTLDTVSVIAWL